MGNLSIALVVLQSGINPELLEDYDVDEVGKKLSTADMLTVNKVDQDSFTVVFDSNEFLKIDMARTVSSIIQTYQTNMPGRTIEFSIRYLYETSVTDEIDEEVARKVLAMDEMCRMIHNNENYTMFDYRRTVSIVDVATTLQDEDDDDEDDDDDEIDKDNNYENYLNLADRSIIDYTTKKKHKRRHHHYEVSSVLRNAKNPKRDVKRHGVIIADSKSDLKKDEKKIKEFLKDFIPGSADWKKEYREDLLKRWMKMYAVSKKTLKYLEKEHRKYRKSNTKKNERTEKALDFTRKMFNVPIDSWNDPNK